MASRRKPSAPSENAWLDPFVERLTPEERQTLLSELEQDWEAIRRPKQSPPAGDWFVWLILAGRGWGKTRTGGEFVAEHLARNPGHRAALVAQSFDDGRDVMVEGESGLEAILTARGVEYRWNRSLGQLLLGNGSRADIYSSERPKQLRGPQHHVAWGDEPAWWKDAHLGDAENTTWSNLKLGLRLGENPQCVLTTTPKAYRLIVDLVKGDADSGIVVTTGSTYENLANLSPKFQREVVARYEGTRLGQQELYAQLLTDVPGALWTRDLIEYGQPPQRWAIDPGGKVLVDDYHRVVVAVDPAVTYGPDSDETGIVVAGQRGDQGYIADDLSGRFSPHDWARRVVAAYHTHRADAVVAESNNGGELVRLNIQSVDPGVPVKLVSASRGKVVRAEPVSALYEQHRVYHTRPYPELEDQLCTYTKDSPVSPDRLDALVWALTELMLKPAVAADDFSVVA